jgi:hypothetical protein
LVSKSQIVTTLQVDSTVTIKKKVAQKVLQDLYTLDNLKGKISLYDFNDSIQKKRIFIKDSIITTYNKEANIYKKIILDQVNQNESLAIQRDLALLQYKKQKRKKLITQIGGGLILTTILIFKH